MICACGGRTVVTNVEHTPTKTTTRRRQCVDCGNRFTTEEWCISETRSSGRFSVNAVKAAIRAQGKNRRRQGVAA